MRGGGGFRLHRGAQDERLAVRDAALEAAHAVGSPNGRAVRTGTEKGGLIVCAEADGLAPAVLETELL